MPERARPGEFEMPRRDAQFVRHAYEAFLDTGEEPDGLDPVVWQSWLRSQGEGVDPDLPRIALLAEDEFRQYRDQHPLASAMPLIRDFLTGATDDGLVVAVSDDVGRLLWVEGGAPLRRRVDRVGFVEGALWGEAQMGTNAPGTALATRRPVQVLGAEHFTRPVQELNCAAAPIRDLATGRPLGVLDVTGRSSARSPVALALVRATAAAVEQHLAVRLAPDATPESDLPEITLLGEPRWRPDGQDRPLSLRHAEILALLSVHPAGLTAAALAVELHAGELSEVTVRAEMSRLRRVVGDLVADSRPYRLSRPVSTDVGRVRDRLACGDVAAAVAAYPSSLLPRSVAPGVEDLRAELDAEMRVAVLDSAEPAVLDRWTRSDAGASDSDAWRALATLSPPGSPAASRARAHLAVLDARFA